MRSSWPDPNEGRTSYKNAGKTLRQGVELAVESELTRNWTGRASLTYMQARLRRGIHDQDRRGDVEIPAGNRIPGVPRLSGICRACLEADRRA